MSAWTQKANKSNGEGFEKAPAGNHPAVLVAMIDMGTQENNFQGTIKWEHRAYFVYELVSCKKQSDPAHNHLIATDLNVTLNEKAKLRKWIEARTGRQIPDGVEYDISQEVGQPCLLNVVMKGDFPKIEGLGSVPTGLPVPPPQYKPMTMTLDEFRKGAPIPDWVPWIFGEKLADRINRCQEISGKGPSAPNGQPPAPPPPAGQAPPPAPSAPPPGGPLFWVDLGNGQIHQPPLDVAAVSHLLVSKGLKEDTQLCAVGSNEWKAAREFGVKLPF